MPATIESSNKPVPAPSTASGPKFLFNLLRSLAYVLRLLRSSVFLLLLLLLAARSLSYFQDANKNSVFPNLIAAERRVEQPAVTFLRRTVPTNFRGKDIAVYMFFFGLFLVSAGLGLAAERIHVCAMLLKRRRTEDQPMPETVSPQSGALYKKLESLQKKHGQATDHDKLLEIYAEAKRTLDQHKRDVVFLSIDVVDSTGMKKGEDPEIAERDFRKYKHMVESALEANGALKAAWTPDGVMACFGSVPDAVRAGQAVVAGLAEFNGKVKAIRKDFAVRIGINAGTVYYDEEMPIEEMTDRVIDIAGHMQKHGTINAVCIARHAIEPHLKEFTFTDASREVDGCPVFEWRPATG